jgi:type IV pilus assembly protein PilA
MNRNRGFTLIEMMAVVSILSILLVIAIAAYQDYVVRSKTGEGMVFAAEAKTSVSSYYYNLKEMPQNNSEAGLIDADEYDKDPGWVKRLELSTTDPYGVINVTFKIIGSPADNKVVQLIPNTEDGTITWTCKAPVDNGMKRNHLPPNCRG